MSRLCIYDNNWASGEIRARQVVRHLGELAVLNPPEVYKDDVCIFVKSLPPDEVLDHVSRSYVDVVDCYGCIPWLREHPKAGVIAISRKAVGYLSEQLGPGRDIRFITEHHCNFEENRVCVKRPTIVGYIGELENFSLKIEKVMGLVEQLGMKFVWLSEFESRLDVCTFYRTIDIQLTFRRAVDGYGRAHSALKNPLKLANAGSFGIPTVGYPEPTYVDEWGRDFLHAENVDAVVYWLDRLSREPELYAAQSELALNKAKQYHIDEVAPKYVRLFENKTMWQIVRNDGQTHGNYPFEERIARRGTEHIDVDKSSRNLVTIANALDRRGVKSWLMFGTLLGVVRDDKLIPHDRDTDIGVFECDFDAIADVVLDLEGEGFELIRTEAGDSTVTIMREDEYTDFYLFHPRGGSYVCPQPELDVEIAVSHFDELDSAVINGRVFSVPSCCEPLFVEWYGDDWRNREDLPSGYEWIRDNIRMVFLPRTSGISSSGIIDSIRNTRQ